MSTTTARSAANAGGAFLIEQADPASIFTPEDLSEEHRQIWATADRFINEEVLPVVGDYEQKKEGLARELITKAGELGLLSILVPEKYDGLEMDLTSQIIVAEMTGRYSSFSTTYGAHSGIGTLPLVFFGTDEQKQRYLPRMATGELLAAYCLSEPHAGSDALAARTRAELSADGKHYVLNGQKMWISNGGWADIFTVFAKIDGEKFTAFLVERGYEGVQTGAEEHKMGIHGSSTTALFLDNVHVPVENVLGEIGRGHVIAFNILNLGRLKLGSSCVGGSKLVLAETIEYAKQRKAFGHAIADFGVIQEKIAEGAIRTFAAESMIYRISGEIDARLEGFSWDNADASKTILKAVEEYAVECSIAKVYGSEVCSFVADEGVQVHGGYGFHQDYMVERSYRDARINRIFEGTNEINRLLTTGMLLKRAGEGRLNLLGAVQSLMGRLAAGDFGAESGEGELGREAALIERGKMVALLGLGMAYQRFGKEIEQQQEVNAALADVIMAVYAMESALLRTRKLRAAGRGEQALEMTRVLVEEGLAQIAARGTTVVAACSQGGELERNYGVLRKLTRSTPINTVELRRSIASRLIASGKYLV